MQIVIVLSGRKTADGLRYSVNQEKYIRVFLSDGEMPIDCYRKRRK